MGLSGLWEPQLLSSSPCWNQEHSPFEQGSCFPFRTPWRRRHWAFLSCTIAKWEECLPCKRQAQIRFPLVWTSNLTFHLPDECPKHKAGKKQGYSGGGECCCSLRAVPLCRQKAQTSQGQKGWITRQFSVQGAHYIWSPLQGFLLSVFECNSCRI